MDPQLTKLLGGWKYNSVIFRPIRYHFLRIETILAHIAINEFYFLKVHERLKFVKLMNYKNQILKICIFDLRFKLLFVILRTQTKALLTDDAERQPNGEKFYYRQYIIPSI